MKKTILLTQILTLSFGIIQFSISAQTTITGGDVSGIWDVSGSPYHILDDITIQAGATLVIEAGVTVESDQNVDIKVFGQLLAIGEANNPIVFSATNQMMEGWGGIEFHDSSNDDSVISNATIKHALAGIWTDVASPTMDSINFTQNATGLFGFNMWNPFLVEVENCKFFENEIGFYADNFFPSEFTNCSFFNNSTAGIHLDNTGSGLTILKFEKCLIYGNEVGLRNIERDRAVVLENCTITNNNGPELVLDYLGVNNNNSIENSILWGGGFEDGIVLVGGATVEVNYSNVSLFSGVFPGTGNLNEAPMFIDVNNNDYNLECSSPCINSGNPDSPLDPDGTIVDMGALWFDASNLNGTATNNSPVCEGTDVTLTAGGGVSYEWSGVNGFSSTSQNPILPSVTPDMAGEYSVSITTSDDCTIELSTEVIINSLPTVEISGGLEFCEGGSTDLTASGGTSYEWSTGETTATIAVTAGGNYTVTATDDNGCADTESVSVELNPLPMAGISGDLEFCEGGSTDLTASGGTSYEWSTSETSVSITVTSPNDYTVTVTNDNGCTDTETVSVVSNSLPMAGIGGDLEFCEGGSTDLTASGGTSYEWSTSETSLSITVTSPNDYTVTVTNDNGCTDSESVTVVMNDLPNVDLILQDTFCFDETDIELTGGTPVDGDYNGTGVTGNIFNPMEAGLGTHTITYTFENVEGCIDSASQEVIVVGGDCTTGINSIENKESIEVFPNPSNGNFTIKLEDWKGEIIIQVFDIQGRLIYSEESKSNLTQIRRIPKGIFLLKLSNEDFYTVRRLIVQ